MPGSAGDGAVGAATSDGTRVVVGKTVATNDGTGVAAGKIVGDRGAPVGVAGAVATMEGVSVGAPCDNGDEGDGAANVRTDAASAMPTTSV